PAQLYFWPSLFIDDYPWVMDFTASLLAPGGPQTAPSGYNFGELATAWQASLNASEKGDIPAILHQNSIMNQFSNNAVMYLWTYYPQTFDVVTSNINGISFNPSLYEIPVGFYFADLL